MISTRDHGLIRETGSSYIDRLRSDKSSPNGEHGDLPTIGAGDEASASTWPTQQTEPDRRRTRRFAAIEASRGIGWLACGVAGSLAIVWFIFLSPGEIGSKAEWFFGAVVFGVIVVTMWQNLNIQHQAKQHAVEAAEQHREELAATEERSARQLALMQRLHRTEMEAQREKARIQRKYLLEQQQK